MATVVTEMTMSLDGYVADPGDGVEELFGWYGNGPVEVPTVGGMPPFRVSAPSAAAGDGLVSVAGGITAQSCLDAGLLDEIRIDLVPRPPG
ncbi:hypothetical protein LUW76_07805 [Actinomadura madurae]|uniref:hypothetical protein n=1 Tax=Actinomadura madurae TaxID=1993 RepID=UPI0020263013|nr:hypothetical protein [Actinomadura madurae]URM94241.1 hypothetical protein LUW76_07805 [Actinomadura madurae]